jgi:hypothetical protein
MLKGFSTPMTPGGRSGIVPPPPWHNAGVVLAIEYQADPANVERFLPPGFSLGPEGGKAIAHFCEWQSVSGPDGSGAEALDPIRAQYQEFFLVVASSFQGEPAWLCPFMYVDNDINLFRGLIQGLPKQAASIRMTRSYPVPGPAAASLAVGSRFGATMSYRDRRLVEARLTLTGPSDTPIGLASTKILGVRHFPDLATDGGFGKPVVHDVVAFSGFGKTVADVWEGEAELVINDAPNQELADLGPISVGRGTRYLMSFSIDRIRKVAEL